LRGVGQDPGYFHLIVNNIAAIHIQETLTHISVQACSQYFASCVPDFIILNTVSGRSCHYLYRLDKQRGRCICRACRIMMQGIDPIKIEDPLESLSSRAGPLKK
jgi:hypothetical protein